MARPQKRSVFDPEDLIRRAIHPSRDVRVSIFEILGHQSTFVLTKDHSEKEKKLLRLVCRCLAYDPDPYVRWHAIESLGLFGTVQDRAVALNNLNHVDPTVRLCAVELLGKFYRKGDESRILPLFNDPDYATRIYAADAIVRTLAQKAVPHLTKHFEVESDLEVRIEVLALLARLQPHGPWGQKLTELEAHPKTPRATDRFGRAIKTLSR